ncbi:DNA-repair protein XRCC1-like isoform X2 [Musa acuminata AAA Group]|uniref:DNA-repair protein XRCC1-like isoform X2 n=1 Tax=Musa acuminata AAA Group TaxID=214697 RepID=UPI0031DD1B16
MGSRDMKNKSSGKKLAVASAKVEVDNFIGSSNACLYETSQNKMDFSKLLEGVVFVLSGFVNPERATLRSKALEMGAEYQPDWTSDCTILVCAFPNTPKFRQVKSDGGTIVSKDWISECHSQKSLVDIVPYLMHVGKPWRKGSKQFDFQQDECDVVHEEPLSQSGRLDVQSSGRKRRAGELATNVDIQFSPSKIKQWAVDDLHRTMSWLERQDEKDVRHVSEQWKFVPRVVKELVELENSSKKGLASKKVLYELAVRCKEIYEEEFDHLNNLKKKQQKADHNQEEEIEDEQVKPDDAGFDSDETIVMTQEEIDVACKQLSENCE